MHDSTQSVRWRPGITDALVALVLLTPVFINYGRFADDPGVGWHLATGEWVAAHGAIPRVDPFLAGGLERPWVSDQWLSDLLLHGIHSVADWAGLYAFLTGIFLLTFFGVANRAAGAASGSWLAAAFATLCAVKLATIHFILRPVMFGFLSFAIVFAICSRLSTQLQAGGGTAPGLRRWLIGLPVVMFFWANLHPSFVLGLVLVGTLTIACFLEPLFFADSRNAKEAWFTTGRWIALSLGACVIATILNPYGPALHDSIFALAGSEFFARFNSEWHSPDFLEGSGQLTMFIFLIIVSSRYLAGSEARRLTLFEFGSLVALTIGYLRSVRLLPFLGIVLVVPVALAVRDLGRTALVRSSEPLEALAARMARLEAWEARSSRGIVGLGFALLVLTYSGATGNFPGREVTYGPTQAHYPHALVQQLVDSGEDAAVFATPNWGGFITWYGEGRVRAIIDDRNTMLGEQAYRSYAAVATARAKDWRARLKGMNATHLLIETDSHLADAARREGFPESDDGHGRSLFEVPR